jgi:glycosyltransferase involved in cell wall biosynthesis
LFGPAFAAALAGHFLGKRVIVKIGSSGPDGEIQTSLRTWRGRVRLAFLRRWADVIIALDDAMYAEALSAGFSAERIRRMANGIDVPSFETNISQNESKDILGIQNKTIALFVGRMVSQKSLPTLLKALGKAVKTCPDLYLVLVGNGPECDPLKTLVDELKMQKYVLFAGNQADVKPYLHAADIFVLPSETEGMSNALMEAMASGLACIATPVGAGPQMLAFGECGVLAPVGNVDAWSIALVDLVRNPDHRHELGNAARQRIRSEYDFSVVGARYETLYRELDPQAFK